MPPENLSGPLYARNGSFSGTWQFSTSGDVSVDGSVLFLALVDYNLTQLYYNGSLGTSHLVQYRTPVSCNVSFELTRLQEGFHEVSFFTVLDPYIGYKDDLLRLRTAGSGKRFKVIEGNATKPEIQYGAGPLEKYVMYQNRSSNIVSGYGPWLTRVPFAEMLDADGRLSDNAIRSMKV